MSHKKHQKKAVKRKNGKKKSNSNKEQKILFYMQLALAIIQLLEEILPYILRHK